MSLAHLAPRVRRRLRWQGWLILLASLGAGVLTNAALWRLGHVTSMALRWAASAIGLYLAMLWSVVLWLRWAAADAAAHPLDWQRASAAEVAGYDARRERERVKRSWGSLEGGANLLDLGELAAVLLVPALIFIAIGLLGLMGAIPMFFGEGMAGLLAELLLQFVLGAWLLRRARTPDRIDGLSRALLARTWWIGLVMVLLSAAAGWWVQDRYPETRTLRELWRR